MESIKTHILSNGITVVHRQVIHTEISHLGIMLDIGSRDENETNQGLAHFWEHMAFKGTQKKNNLQIINRLEVIGGELNAYTTKEKICFHASVLSPHYERALELLSDITFNSTFPEKELEKERFVILEEMAMYYDNPEDAIQDDFDEVLFPNHSLGYNILGVQQTVSNFQPSDLRKFIDEHLDTHRIVVSSIGKLSHHKVFQWAEKHLGGIAKKSNLKQRVIPKPNAPLEKKIKRGMSQSQVAIGRQSFEILHPDRLAFFMIINLLGGPGMNSMLNVSVREKHGLVYNIDASFTSYMDSGFWAIYFGTEPNQVNKALKLIGKEMNKLKEKTLSPAQLQKIKSQLKGQLAMAEEGNLNFMLMMAKSLLDREKIESLEEIFQQIDAISPQKVQELSNQMFQEDQISRLIFEP
ncbi:insulinase family protein [Sandaracinomonas limnophila]|uniref:Insulinase family protein n=1 Tax=Sandaracinomonas limnophila TaxID=1862386 RepID=A0A437PW66_9BACT|nr:pitrilysin family protein [Sandaracinomonas limnophila]RVU26480.1 insulinase family protein [Sandaracinomonas limnophila]